MKAILSTKISISAFYNIVAFKQFVAIYTAILFWAGY
jgi:hypothetical protein